MTKEITINPIGSPTVVTFPNWKIKGAGSVESYVVLVGNISDGFSAYGPFYSFDSASEYVDKFDDMSWIMEMYSAEPPKKPSLA